MMRLDCCRLSIHRAALYYIGINCALTKPACTLYLLSLGIKHIYEGLSYGLSFCLRITKATEGLQKQIRASDPNNIQPHIFVRGKNVFKLIFAQKAVIYKNTVKIISYGPVHRNSRNS